MQPWIPLFVLLTVSQVVGHRSATSMMIPRRRYLEDANGYFEWDIGDFGVRFSRCQYVKMFDDELADDEDSDTILAVRHFVLFDLCPANECSSCNGVHGEYVLEIDDYLDATVEFQTEMFEYMCENCNEQCYGDSCDQDGCGKLCYQYDNLEANGFVDASEYLECQQLRVEEDEEDEGEGEDGDGNDGEETQLYIGPKCSSDGSRIVIGLFSDENCWEPYTEQSVNDVLGMKLSYHVLSHILSRPSDDSACLSCREDADDNNANDQADADNVNEMCEGLYSYSAKCESPYGLDNGFVQMKREEEEYENQVENEFMACNFINSLKWKSYTETGEINIVDEQDEVFRYVTPLQKAVLSSLVLFAAGMIGYGVHLHQVITKRYPPMADLAPQTDHMVT